MCIVTQSQWKYQMFFLQGAVLILMFLKKYDQYEEKKKIAGAIDFLKKCINLMKTHLLDENHWCDNIYHDGEKLPIYWKLIA